METFIQDVRFALRMLRKAPGFTAVVVITLALGVGANTALFSVVDAVLLRPLAFPHPQQLVSVKTDMPGINLFDGGMSEPELDDLQKRSGVFSGISAVWPISANITGREKPLRVEANAVSVNFFTLLNAKPAIGRVFTESDYRPGFAEGAVISDSLWHTMFGGDPNVLGQSIRLDTDLYTIIGVMAPAFRHPGRTLRQDVEVWVASGYAAAPFPQPPARVQRFIPGAIARLEPGLTVEQAQSRLDAFAAQLHDQYPNDYPASARWRVRLVSLQQELVGKVSLMLFLLLAAVGTVLLIACVNIASLLLARSSVRYREIAVRQALGASAWRLIRQTLTESVVLSVCGGLLAVPLAFALKNILLTLVPSSLPRIAEITIDGRTLLFVAGVSILTGILFGLAPAVQTSDRHLVEKLSAGSRGVGIGARQHGFLRALVVSEFALSLVLMVGAGLLLRSFWKALAVQPGFNSDNLIAAQFWMPVPNDPKNNPYPTQEKLNAFTSEVLRQLEALPGIKEAAIGGGVTPIGTQRNPVSFTVSGRVNEAGDAPTAEFAVASSGLFHVLQTPLLRGRVFTDADDDKGEKVVLIDQTTAERYFHDEDPIGKQIKIAFGINQPLRRIVGVVGRIRTDGLDLPYMPHVFVPMRQAGNNSITVYVRSAATPEQMEEPIRRAVQAVNPDLPVFGVRSVRSIVSDSLASRRFALQIIVFFAGTAMLLAAIGIYGVMAYFVNQRVREIGVRMALGAQRSDVLKLVVGQGMSLALFGLAVGLAASLLLMRLISGLLFEVSASDPVTLFAFTALLAAVALLANYVPASRAARIDPMVALRQE